MEMSSSSSLSKHMKCFSKINRLRKGVVFWYKHRGRQYGGVVMEVSESACRYYLIAISEELGKNRNIDTILGLPLYTVAWFSEYTMLSLARIHILGLINIKKDSTNRYGIRVSPTSIQITNCGQRATWAHQFRAFTSPKTTLLDMLQDRGRYSVLTTPADADPET